MDPKCFFGRWAEAVIALPSDVRWVGMIPRDQYRRNEPIQFLSRSHFSPPADLVGDDRHYYVAVEKVVINGLLQEGGIIVSLAPGQALVPGEKA